MSKACTHGWTTLVCKTATGVLWTAFLTTEEYHRYIRKWVESGDPCEAFAAIARHE